MKVLQVNCVYKNGSTGKIVYDLHRGLQDKGIESIVCYGRGKTIEEDHVYKTSTELAGKFNNVKSRFTGLQYNGSFIATRKLINIIKKENPDVVHLHCINGFFVNIYKLVIFLKENNIKTILTLHAEFMYTGSCGHSYECEKWKTNCSNCPNLKDATNSYFFDRTKEAWKKMNKAFKNFKNLKIISVSPWLEERARESAIFKNKYHSTILNGIDTKNVFKPRDVSELKRELKLDNEKIILHVTPDFQSECKGGKYILEIAKQLEYENIKIIVVGNTGAKIVGYKNIIDIGRVNGQIELSKYYSLADVTLLTSKRETFSMVCAESISCGTSVVGFKAGAPELISDPSYSEFVEYNDINGLIKSLLKAVRCDKKNKKICKEKYSKEWMINQYLECYKEL